MKIFISQGMQGRSNEEILIERDLAIADIKNHYGEETEINSEILFNSKDEGGKRLLYYLGKAIEKASDADMVYFCKGYKDYRGCQILKLACEMYGVPTIEQV